MAYIRKLSLFAVKIIRRIQSKSIGKLQLIVQGSWQISVAVAQF